MNIFGENNFLRRKQFFSEKKQIRGRKIRGLVQKLDKYILTQIELENIVDILYLLKTLKV